MRKIETFFIRTYGCQMNELDSEVMRGLLEKRNLTFTSDEEKADLIIFNTCAIRDLAERKVLGKIGQLSRKETDRPIIGITGCMANAKKESLFHKLPYVDFIIGTNNIHQLNTALDEVLEGKTPIYIDPTFTQELDYLSAKRTHAISAYVSIIRGCNNHCTYCVVPYTRGPEVSRTPEEIVKECRQLGEQGYKEITLLGQNVNSYGKDQPQWNTLFPDLLDQLDQLPGIERIRFMTSHPVDISRNLMEAIRDLSSVCEFVHFPLQAGSNRILKKMHRKYTIEEYEEKVAMLRSLVPNVSIGTDIIVGFPTETEEEFEETAAALKRIRFSTAFIFAYSKRKNTPAARWNDDIPQKTKEQRLHNLLDIQQNVTQEYLQMLIGTTVELLVESTSKDTTLLKGRTRQWQQVLFPGTTDKIGTIQQVQIHSFSNQTCIGEVIASTARQTSLPIR